VLRSASESPAPDKGAMSTAESRFGDAQRVASAA
jgi:hypothetical protein